MVFLPIPNFERYLISKNGTILDTVAEELIQKQDEINLNTKARLIYTNRTNRFRLVSVARLILMTHVPIEGVDLTTVWGPKLRNVNGQISADNLDYDFGDYQPPKPSDNNEFHPVPGYIETEINLSGIVKMSGKEVKLGDQRGYTVASARTLSGNSVTVGRHRLMALTFLKHPIFCSDLIVNHINGKPSDDRIDNLEWCSYQRNIVHAHDSKLIINHNPVIVKNLITGEVKEFFSIGAFSREFNLNEREFKRLEFRIRTFGVINNYRGFSLQKKSMNIDWDELPGIDGYRGNIKEVQVIDAETCEVKEFVNFSEAALFLGVSQFRLRNALKTFGEVSIGKFKVSYLKPSILAGNSKVEKDK